MLSIIFLIPVARLALCFPEKKIILTGILLPCVVGRIYLTLLFNHLGNCDCTKRTGFSMKYGGMVLWAVTNFPIWQNTSQELRKDKWEFQTTLKYIVLIKVWRFGFRSVFEVSSIFDWRSIFRLMTFFVLHENCRRVSSIFILGVVHAGLPLRQQVKPPPIRG